MFLRFSFINVVMAIGAVSVFGSNPVVVGHTQTTPAAPLASSQSRISYLVQPGDKLRDIAARFLGSSNDVSELRNYNNLDDHFEPRPGDVIMLPGSQRDIARERIDRAELSMSIASQSMAQRYAGKAYMLANRTFNTALEALHSGMYSKAEALGILTEHHATQAKSEADEKAIVHRPATLTRLVGDVEVSTDLGRTWSSAVEGQEIDRHHRVRTASDTRAAFTLHDGSVVVLQPESEVELSDCRFDARDNAGNLELDVRLGAVLAKIKPLSRLANSLKVKNKNTVIAVRGTTFRFGSDARETTLISLLEGEVGVTSNAEESDLEQNYGIYVIREEPPSEPVKLLSPPEVVVPTERIVQVARQQQEFRWAHRALIRTDAQPLHRPLSRGKFASYHLEIARDADFLEIVQDFHATDNHLISGSLLPGTYFWRLSAIDENGLEGPSSNPGILHVSGNNHVRLAHDDKVIRNETYWLAGPDNVFRIVADSTVSSVSAFELSINDKPYQSCLGGVHLRHNGIYTVRVRGVSADGRTGPPFRQEIWIDDAPPNIETYTSRIQYDEAGRSMIYLSASSVDESGIRSFEYSINSSSFVPVPGRIPIYCDEYGTAVALRAVDLLGNTEFRTVQVPPCAVATEGPR